MSWYKTGTISVTNGSTTVNGAGTLFVDIGILNPGDMWRAPDEKYYEILSFQSNTEFTLVSAYLGTTVSGASYAIVPIGLLPSTLAQQVKSTLTTANTALESAVLSNTNTQGLTPTQQQNARTNIAALSAADVGAGRLGKSVAGNTDVTLTAAEAANQFLEFTGVLTGNINVIVPAAARLFSIYNATSGAYTLTVKTASGAGVAVKQAGRMFVECDSVNVTNPTFGCDANFGDITALSALFAGTIVNNMGGNSLYCNNPANTGSYWLLGNSIQTNYIAVEAATPAFITDATMGDLSFVGGGGISFRHGQAGGIKHMRLSSTGLALTASIIVGNVSTGTSSSFSSSYAANVGSSVISVGGTENAMVAYVVTGGSLGNAANSAVKVNKDAITSRSINAAGTINASGADYAEYENNNGLIIAKGSVVGFKSDGTLTPIFSEAIRFGIKSTNPSYVGGDTWGGHASVGIKPGKPEFVSPEYVGVENPVELQAAQPVAPILNLPAKPILQDGETSEILAMRIANWQQFCVELMAVHQSALVQYPSILADWQSVKAAHDAAQAQYDADLASYAAAVAAAQAEFDLVIIPAHEVELATFNAKLEAARQNVDRIAYSGKVPVNVTGCTPGGYVIAAQGAGDSIVGQFVIDPDFTQYKKAVGRVNRILEDGRAEVAVMVH